MQHNWEKYTERLVRDYSHFLLIVSLFPPSTLDFSRKISGHSVALVRLDPIL